MHQRYIITHRDEDGRWWVECKNGTVVSTNERHLATRFTDLAIASAIAEVLESRKHYHGVEIKIVEDHQS